MRYLILKPVAFLMLGFVLIGGNASISLAADNNADDNVVFSSTQESLLSAGEMDINRGAFGINTNILASNQSLVATGENNSLTVYGNMANGDIAVGDNMRGFGSFVMNTGNNSSISSAVNVSVQMLPTP